MVVQYLSLILHVGGLGL